MGVQKIEELADQTLIHIHEPTHYGQPDVFRRITVPHNPGYRHQLPTMTRERFEHPKYDPHGRGVERMETVNIASIGTLVFVLTHDPDWSSSTYNANEHSVTGPFLLVDSVEPDELHTCSNCGKQMAVCNWSSESDGAAWTWISWQHVCQDCQHEEKKTAQYPYGHEVVDQCQICGANPNPHV